MYKKLPALIFLLAMLCVSCVSSEASDSYNSYFWLDMSTEADVYRRVYNSLYGNNSNNYNYNNSNFFYQLRDITGATRSDKVAGPQWFATVYENYYRNTYENNNNNSVGVYRRTMGGEIPDITFRAVGDILDGFNLLFAEEPQPYNTILLTNIGTARYDTYPDPLESFCLVITNGQADFNISFGNPYARHFPFWWWNTVTSTSGSSKWWQNGYNSWSNISPNIVEPIEYIYSNYDIYSRNADREYVKTYTYNISPDLSGDTTIGYSRMIVDTSGSVVLTLSGDLTDNTHYWCDSDGNIVWSVSSDDKVYDAGGNEAYTLERESNGDIYICSARPVYEEIAFDDFDENYNITLNPSEERPVLPGNYITRGVRVRGIDSSAYGSTKGYVSFRQRASFAPGYSNYRQSTLIPVVIANVSNGNASDNPLLFDMIVSKDNNIVNRIKFTWDVQSDMPDQDLGTFFMMKQFNSGSNPKYSLETRITNRTGTRYELYRYDEINLKSRDVNYRDSYREIMPDYWKYDLTPDMYGTLPDYFLLDAHSQIAPGLVTVYRNNIGSGYSTIETQYDTSESFRLYEYSSTSPKNLRLKYKRIAGMTTAGDLPYSFSGPAGKNDTVILQGFSMQFTDVIQDENETEYELTNLMGKPPAMVPAELSTVIPAEANIRSSALNSFRITQPVPVDNDANFALLVSYEEINEDQPVTSDDNANPPATGEGASDISASTSYTSLRAALQPVSVRLKISRNFSLVGDIWEELDSASNSRQLFERFANRGAIWVRSSATREMDTNLFTAINNKGSSIGVSASDCINAFLYDDELYLDFMVFIADAKSIRSDEGRTAFIEVFKDDDVPYILIGDGAVDKVWDLTFFVDATGSNPGTRDDGNNDPGGNEQQDSNSGSGGGGGCNTGITGIAVMILMGMFKVSRKS